MDGTWIVGPTGIEVDGSIRARINDPIVKVIDSLTGTNTSRSTGTWMDKLRDRKPHWYKNGTQPAPNSSLTGIQMDWKGI